MIKTIILLMIVVVIEVLAAGAIGAERYGIHSYGVHRKLSEWVFKAVSFVIAVISVSMYVIFAEQGIFDLPFSGEAINSIAMIMMGSAMVFLWLKTLDILSDDDVDNDLLKFIFALLEIGMMFVLLASTVEIQHQSSIGYFETAKGIVIVGSIIYYYVILYEASIIGGNLQTANLEKKIQSFIAIRVTPPSDF